MTSVLIVFESRYGQSEKIAAFARDVACRCGLSAEALRVGNVNDVDIAAHPAIVIVAPIYLGRHPRAIEAFLRDHADTLSTRRAAFLSVSNSAANASAAVRAGAVKLAETFVASVGLRPVLVATVGGALAYPRYGFLLRFVMKQIARRSGESQDTSRRHELTDWPSLDELLSRFFESLAVDRGSVDEGRDLRRTADRTGTHARSAAAASTAQG